MKRFFRMRLNESNPFLNTTQRMKRFFFEYDSMNWTLFNTTRRIELFFNTTHRIEPFFLWYDSKYWTSFVWLSLWIELFFQEIWLDSSNWTSCYEPLFKMTQRIEPLVMNLFSIWFKELNPSQNVSKNWTSLSLKELNFFQYDAKIFQIDSKELNPLFSMTQRIEPLFWIWRKEWNPCSLNTTQRIEPFFLWIRRKE